MSEKCLHVEEVFYRLKQASRMRSQKLDGGLKRFRRDSTRTIFSKRQHWVNVLKKEMAAKFLKQDLNLAYEDLGIRMTDASEGHRSYYEHYVQQLLERFGVRSEAHLQHAGR